MGLSAGIAATILLLVGGLTGSFGVAIVRVVGLLGTAAPISQSTARVLGGLLIVLGVGCWAIAFVVFLVSG